MVTTAETAQAALDAIKRECENLNENVLTALIANPGAISKLGKTAGRITIEVEE